MVLRVRTQMAPEGVRILHETLAGNDIDDIVEVLLVLHVGRLLAAHDDRWPHELMIGRAEIDLADSGLDALTGFVRFDHIRWGEGPGALHRIGPHGKLHVGVVGAPLRLVAIFLVESLDEHLGEWILVLEGPPEISNSVHTLHNRRPDLAGEERRLVGDYELLSGEDAKLLCLLDR